MILGWSEGFHDAGAAVIDDSGSILFATHSERFSGKKHEKYISKECKDYIDSTYGSKIIKKAFYERPVLKKTRQLYAGQYSTVFSPRKMAWKPTHTFPHHLSHAAAAFQTSPYNEAAAVVVDAIGEWDCTSIWKCSYNEAGEAQYKKVYSERYPKSIGLWYTALTKYVGLKPLDEEYIFMGMAAYGKYDANIEDSLSMLLNNGYNLHRGIHNELGNHYGLSICKSEDLAFNAQTVLERKLKSVFDKALTYSNKIVYGGGVALNCVANSKLYEQCEGNLWIMPNPGDAGGALGAACLAYGKKVTWTSPYLGYCIPNVRTSAQIVKDVCDELEAKGMVGLAWGKAEYGPRALGNRSLLADPRGPKVKDLVNTVKRRQKFRPFAPAILEEHAKDYFDGPTSRYMQTVSVCKKADELPAIVHADGSSRVQTVSKGCATILRSVLEEWHRRTGCPVLLNTSLNIRGEPMVHSTDSAIRFEKEYNVKVIF